MGGVSLNVGSQAIGDLKNIDYLNKTNYNGKDIYITRKIERMFWNVCIIKNAYFCSIFG